MEPLNERLAEDVKQNGPLGVVDSHGNRVGWLVAVQEPSGCSIQLIKPQRSADGITRRTVRKNARRSKLKKA